MQTLQQMLLVWLALGVFSSAADATEFAERRQRAAAEFRDGILMVHAKSDFSMSGDGFRQDPIFYYLTGLENTIGAILLIDGKTGESWLFLPSEPPMSWSGLRPEVQPGHPSEQHLALNHVVDWSELPQFLAGRASAHPTLYFARDPFQSVELPGELFGVATTKVPTWLRAILQRWPSYDSRDANERLQGLMAVQSLKEVSALRMAGKATVSAVMEGMRDIKPGVTQRSVEALVESSCWKSGAHGVAFWPWVMGGSNGVFPRPFAAPARYDHLNSVLRPGDLVRLDVGCEWDHYQGDLGRTVPVGGHFDDGQREVWNIFVAAYHAGAAKLRVGIGADQVFDAWRIELESHRDSARTSLARRAIASWVDRKNVPFWGIHTTNLTAGEVAGVLKAGTTINFEPIASIDGQGYFLEDMYLIRPHGAELLTPGVPYSAEEIEAAMNHR